MRHLRYIVHLTPSFPCHFFKSQQTPTYREVCSSLRTNMLFAATIFLALLACRSFALPAHSSTPHRHAHSRYEVNSNWDQGAVNQYPIHPSCNHTETTQLRIALAELEALAEHAAAHVLRWGNSSEIYQKYFGDAPSAPVIGNFERVVNGDKAHTLFRCDDPDGNCQIPSKSALT